MNDRVRSNQIVQRVEKDGGYSCPTLTGKKISSSVDAKPHVARLRGSNETLNMTLHTCYEKFYIENTAKMKEISYNEIVLKISFIYYFITLVMPI
jgi:hypothetical protein